MIRVSPFATALLLAAVLPAQNNPGWSPPVLETLLNSTASESGPSLSLDGLTLHFSSSVSGNWEIYMCTRAGLGQPWSAPSLVAGPSDPTYVDDQPFMTADGLELWFGSTNRAGGAGGSDILVCKRPNQLAPWGVPSFVAELNSSGSESSPSLTGDGLEIYFLSSGWGAPSAPNNAVFHAVRSSVSQPFGTPTLVNEFLTTYTHRDAEVSFDGLSFCYTEYESAVLRRMQVMNSDRAARGAPWNAPTPWSELTFVGSSIGVYGFTRSFTGNEAVLAANFGSGGAQELMSTRFDGLTHLGVPSSSGSLTLFYRDSGRPGRTCVMAAAMGNTGFPYAGLHIPLDPDFLFSGTFARNLPPVETGFFGVLDANGEAQALLTNPGSVLLGLPVLWVGAFTLDPLAPFGLGSVSNAVPFQFQ